MGLFQQAETPRHKPRRYSSDIGLLLRGSTHRARICARAALDALIRIDHVLAVTFADRIHGAFGRASATADALVGNFVSQCCHLHRVMRAIR